MGERSKSTPTGWAATGRGLVLSMDLCRSADLRIGACFARCGYGNISWQVLGRGPVHPTIYGLWFTLTALTHADSGRINTAPGGITHYARRSS